MRQVLQSLKTGVIELAETPCPMVRPGHLLIQSSATLISAGTERMLVEFGQAGWIAKARAQPEKVRQVLAKIKTDGLMPTLETVFARLDEPLPLGYCNAGRVVEVGRGVEGYQVGDRVASNGPHAEMVCVPTTLCAKIPDDVSDTDASFTVLGSISLHGVRLLEPTLGEHFVVVGLGLLGLVAVQLLRASGCNVLGIDVNRARCEAAMRYGAQTACIADGADPVQAASAFSGGYGVDGVLVCASAKTDEIMHQAAEMCRKRGRIVLVGVVGLNLKRADFYEKELSFRVSCSYGPGRYDPTYEQQARDYPRAYVRWTEGRNFEAMLDAMRQKRLNVASMVSRRFAHAEAAKAYDAVVNDSTALGIVLEYPAGPAPTAQTIRLAGARSTPSRAASPTVGVIGAGNFTKLVLLPAIRATGAPVRSIASAGGVSGLHAGRKFDAEEATTDSASLLADPDINAVFITTRHSAHAAMVCDALAAGKHVFVEKPLAIDEEQLDRVRRAVADQPGLQLMVGFNRRFAPHTLKMQDVLRGRSQPIAVNLMVNAGAIPPDHWTQDAESGGGRIIGEGCHFIDLALALVGHPIVTVQATMFGPQAGRLREDKMSISLGFADGSIAAIHYWANGPKSYPKERVEIFSEGRVAVIDNWRRLSGYDWNLPSMKITMDKGHREEVRRFVERVGQGGAPLIPFDQLENVTAASFAAVAAARDGGTIRLERADSLAGSARSDASAALV